jgi:hypothetical protein
MGASLSISVSVGSMDIANNRTPLTVSVKVTATGSTYNMVDYGAVKLWGSFSASGSSRFAKGTTTTLLTTTQYIYHNDDGTGSYSFGASYNTNVSPGTITAYASGGLSTIPRASEFTINKSSLNINATGSTSQSASISITKKNSSFTHKLYYSFGSGSSLTAGLSTASPGTSCTFTPPVGLGAYIPSALSGTCTLTLDTYSGSTKIGTKSTSLTLNVDTSLSDFQLKGSIALSENNSALTGSA